MENNRGGGEGRRVVLVAYPLQGHIIPILHLGTILFSRGFSITVVHAHHNSPSPSNHPHFHFLSIPDGLSDGDRCSADLMGMVFLLNANCRLPLQECLVEMVERPETYGKIACIIYDSLLKCSEAVAAHLKLPNIMLRTSCLASSMSYVEIPRLHRQGYLPPQDSMWQEAVPEAYPLRFKDLPLSNFLKIEDVLRLISDVSDMGTTSAIIWNTMDFLEQPLLPKHQQVFPNIHVFMIGPLHKIAPSSSSGSLLQEDTSCITWLDKQSSNSVIYVSIGSVVSMDKEELTEMAWGLANSKQPFLWVIRPRSVRGSEWIELLPEGFRERVGERGCIVKWAPQTDVLEHPAVGGFWCHCGWNSVVESISAGVPMLCRPAYGDQRVIARYLCCLWKVGLELENALDRGDIGRAVRRLMVDKEGEEVRQSTMESKKKTELCVREGGSSCKSLNQLIEYILSF